MPSLNDIRSAIKTRLATITGLRTFAYVPDQLPVPAAFVGGLESVEYDFAGARNADRWSIPVRVVVSRATDRAAQAALDAYLAGSGASSLKAALEGDVRLGGVAQTLRVQNVREAGVYEHGGMSYLGAEFVVDVIA